MHWNCVHPSFVLSVHASINLIPGLDKYENLSLPFGQPALQCTCRELQYFEIAQSSVIGQTNHENCRPRLPVGQVTDEICWPNRKIYLPETIGHGSCRAFAERCLSCHRIQYSTVFTSAVLSVMSSSTIKPQKILASSFDVCYSIPMDWFAFFLYLWTIFLQLFLDLKLLA